MSWEKDGKVPFIVLSTGRCGTNALAKILQGCKNVEIKKSGFPVPWYGPPSPDLIEWLKAGTVLRGDISEYLLPHAYSLNQAVPDLKTICMHREMEPTVKSMARWLRPMLRPQDQLMWRNNKWVQMYPCIDAATATQAFEFWWRMYEYETAKIPTEGKYDFHTQDLNDDSRLSQLYDYLEIPDEDRNFPEIGSRQYDPFKEEAMEYERRLAEEEAANG